MPPLCLFFLGPPYVTLNSHPVDEFRSDKVRALLAYLALEADHPHRRDALAGMFWPELPDQVARNNLRLSLHRLRLALGDTGKTSLYLHLTAESVQWQGKTIVSLDITTFTTLLAKTAVHPHRRLDACPLCMISLHQAADLYQGEFLQGFFLDNNLAFSEWVLIWRERLQRQALRALFHLAEYHRRRGEHELALRYATRQLEMEPWREEAHRQVMYILAARGERSAALKQYETCRSLLQEELGIEPSLETAELYHRLLKAIAHHNLPPTPTPMIGRQEELAELTAILADPDCRLLTITGAGGNGKTRLAMQTAARQMTAFLDGICFVPLDGLLSADYLVTAVLHALHFTSPQTDDPQKRLLDYLRPKELLLVLDNFEHLLDGADLVAEWLQNAPQVKLLVTSRERLHLAEEWVFDLPGLDYPAEAETEVEKTSAVQLFVQVAQRNQRQYRLTAVEKPYVAHICRLVAGSPLAIELAAAQAASHTGQQIVQAIEQNLASLTSSWRNVPPRHRSLWAVFDHSWRLLTAVEQEVLARLSVFRGGFDAVASEQITGVPLELLTRLVDKSLVQIAVTEPRRYALHELTRQYTHEQLNRGGQLEQTQKKHLAYFLQLVVARATQDMEGRRPEWVEELARERENIRAALAWSLQTNHIELGLHLASGLWAYWMHLGQFTECRRWLEQLVEQAEQIKQECVAQPPTAAFDLYYGQAVRNLGNVCWYLNEYDTAVAYLEHSITIFQANENNKLYVAGALRPLARIISILGDRTRAHALTTQALSLFQVQQNQWGIIRTLIDLGQLLVATNNFPKAMSYIQEALTEARAHGRKGLEADALMALGEAYWYQGRAEQAEQCFLDSLVLLQKLPPLLGVSMVLQDLAFVAFQQKDWQKAQTYLQEAARICEEMNDMGGYGSCLVGLAAVAQANGRLDEAARLQNQLTGILHLCHPQLYKPGQMFWSLFLSG